MNQINSSADGNNFINESGSKHKIAKKEMNEFLDGSDKIKKAKEQFFMKKIASNIYKLTQLV